MKTKDKTLVILTPAFPANETESTWVPAVQLFVRKLKENFPGINITVLSFNYPSHTNSYLWNDISITGFNGMHKKKIHRLLLWRRVLKKLKQLKKEQTILGLFSFWCGECALVGKYFGKKHAIRHYCWISGMDARKENKLVKWIRPVGNELIAMSPFLVEEFYRNHGVKPGHIIPIGIDTAEYGSRSTNKDIDIIGVGSLHQLKQYDVFIRVVKKVSVVFPGIKAVICGDGQERDRLERMIRELHLENNLSLAGEKAHDEVLQWMQRAKIFLHTSAYEGFGMVYLEALYAGARVVSFTYPLDHPHPHWQVAAGPDEMAEKILAILKDNNIQYKPSLVYTMDDSTKKIMQLFRLNKE